MSDWHRCDGHGWIEVDAPAIRQARISPAGEIEFHHLAPQMTVHPCQTCQPARHARWLRGHYPCPQRPTCNACRAEHNLSVGGDEFLPGGPGPSDEQESEPDPAVPLPLDEFQPR